MNDNRFGFGWALAGILFLAAATFAGIWWLLPQSLNLPEGESLAAAAPRTVVHRVFELEQPEKTLEIVETADGEEWDEWPEDALENELLIAFRSSRDLERFYQRIRGSGIEVVGVIDELNAVRVRFAPGEERFVREAAEGGEVAFNYLANNPDFPEWNGPAGAPLRPGAGLEGDFLWGEGVRVAVLDTGVAAHPALANALIGEINLLDDGPNYTVGTHGTAVASIIAGDGDVTGLAPGAKILSIRVLNEEGIGNTFLLAHGIIEAANQGVDFISVSLGSNGTNGLLDDAIAYARSKGIVIVAAAGNSGQGQLMYPARHPDVVGVTAVDHRGILAPFSNYGDGVTFAAPGVGLPAALGEEGYFYFTGTSAANPYAIGSMALAMTAFPGVSPEDMLAFTVQYADDTGPAGVDRYHGHGMVNSTRVVEHTIRGIYDAALTGHMLMRMEDGSLGVQVPVQNRGTETLNNVRLSVTIDGRRQVFNLGTFRPTETRAEILPLGRRHRGLVEVESFVEAPFVREVNMANNRIGTRFNLDAIPD